MYDSDGRVGSLVVCEFGMFRPFTRILFPATRKKHIGNRIGQGLFSLFGQIPNNSDSQ